MEKPRTHDPNSSSSAFPHALGAGARGSNALKLVKPANMKELIEESRQKSGSVLRGSFIAFSQSQLDGFKRNLNELADTMTSQYEMQQSILKSGSAAAPAPDATSAPWQAVTASDTAAITPSSHFLKFFLICHFPPMS